MCKNKHFQSLGMKNKLFKVQRQKTKLMYNFDTKTIFWPKMYYARIPNQTISFNIIKFSVIKCNFSKKKKKHCIIMYFLKFIILECIPL